MWSGMGAGKVGRFSHLLSCCCASISWVLGYFRARLLLSWRGKNHVVEVTHRGSGLDLRSGTSASWRENDVKSAGVYMVGF